MSRHLHRRIFWVAVVPLLALHMDPWSASSLEPVSLGWIPRDLGYHLAWVVAATALTLYMCSKVWPDDA